MNNEYFEKSKEFFEHNDVTNALNYFEKVLSYIDHTKEKANYIRFLDQILEHCKNNQLLEQQAIVLRSLGRTYSIFKNYIESLKYHQESLKIQRRLGKKKEVAEGLLFLAEDLEISGNYEECVNAFQSALDIYYALGKLSECKKIKKELKRLKEFSKEVYEDEYIINKFHLNRD